MDRVLMFDDVKRLRLGNILLDYYVTPDGKIFNTKLKRLKDRPNNRGYRVVDLYLAKKDKRTLLVHRLVAILYIPNPLNLPTVNHKDGNKRNNSVDNLEWVTYGENNSHAYQTGLHRSLKGTESPFAKHDEETIRTICKMLEKNMPSKSISKILGVNISLVRSIKSRESWTSVSQEYEIPIPRFYMTKDIEKEITQLLVSGSSIESICRKIGWQADAKCKKRIKRIAEKVQRLSPEGP